MTICCLFNSTCDLLKKSSSIYICKTLENPPLAMQLSLDKVLKTEIDSRGIQPGSILKQQHNYESFKARIVRQKKPDPVALVHFCMMKQR